MRTLLHLILTNSEIRKLLSDFSVIGRDLLAKGAHKVADLVAPNEEALRQVDEPVPHGRFVSEGDRQAGPSEAPVRAPGTETSVDQHPKEGQASGSERPAQEVQKDAARQVDQSRLQAEDRKEQASGQGPGVKEAATTEDAEKKRQGLIGKMKDVRVSN